VAEGQQRIGEFYAEVVLPALAARLDVAFPEFGWRPDARDWVASNQETREFQPRRPRACASRRRVESRRLGDTKDPDGFVREHGLARFRDLVDGAVCAVTWHALELTGDTSADDPVEQRRDALRCAGRWLGSLPARLSFEQEDAIARVGARCGYSRVVLDRTFRARYWDETRSLTREGHTRGLGIER
jgi:hypothetical protein